MDRTLKAWLRPLGALGLAAGVVAAQAGPVTVDSVLRFAEADVDAWSAPDSARAESTAGGHFFSDIWLNNSPKMPSADIRATHVSDLTSDDQSLRLYGSFNADPYWYWHMQAETYGFGATVEFTLEAMATYTLAWSQSCYYWKTDTHYCPEYRAQFRATIDGNGYGPGSGVRQPGRHVVSFTSSDYDPWNGTQHMDFDFALVASPVSEPGALAASAAALAALAALRRRRGARA